MTSLPKAPAARQLGLVIDLDICVGCHACAVNCKEWNTGGHMAPLTDLAAYGAKPNGVWFNRIHSYEVESEAAWSSAGGSGAGGSGGGEGGCGGGSGVGGSGVGGRTVHFPKSCLHCAKPDCVTVCPTGASYKRAEDGIVLVNEDICIGCKLCSWACPYGAREFDEDVGVMKKCTLCIDRIYNENLPETDRVPACVATCPTSARHFGDLGDPQSEVSKLVAARAGYDLMPELGYQPTNKYLPPRPRRDAGAAAVSSVSEPVAPQGKLNPFLRWVDNMLSR